MTRRNEMRLPSLSFDTSKVIPVGEELDATLTRRKREEAFYKRFRYDQENRVGVAKSTASPTLTLGSLELAPRGFFDKFNSLSASITAEIVSKISEDNKSIIIAQHRRNPTDENLKEQILYIVASEFDQLARKNQGIQQLSAPDRDILQALVINEVIGLGPLEPLWNAKTVTEIFCNGPFDVQVEIGGIVRRIPSVKFRSPAHLGSLMDKLYSSVNKQLSPVNPRERGRLPDNSRIYGVHQAVAPLGPNFNIRKHSEEYWTPLDVINKGTASPELMAHLGNLIHAGVSFLVVGGTGTGKTTLLNSLTGFIPTNARVVTLEENLEMKPHPKKLIAAPMECVPSKAGDDKEFGVSMRDLVRSSLQMRPDYILIGEVSDGAAYDLCQALNTGHSGGSTVHANDAQDSLNRLRSLVSQEEFVRGPAVLDLIGSAFDIIVVIDRFQDGSRKISEVVELGRNPIKLENGELSLEIKPLWKTHTSSSLNSDNELVVDAHWEQVGELSEYRKEKHRLNLIEDLSWDELLEISTYNVGSIEED